MNDSTPAVPPESLLAHADFVRGVVGRIIQDENLAEDAVQDTWMAALRRPPHRRETALGWLRTVARNVSLRRLRDRARLGERETTDSDLDHIDGSSGEGHTADVVHAIGEAVLRLPETFRDVVLLRYYEGLSTVEVAERLSVSQGTVRSRLHRASTRLRRALDHRFGDARGWRVVAFALAPPASSAVSTGTAATGGVFVMLGKAKLLVALSLLILVGWYVVDQITRDDHAPVRRTSTPRNTLSADSVPNESRGSGLDIASVPFGSDAASTGRAKTGEPGPIAWIRGRTVDARRRPVAGVRLRLALSDGKVLQARSGEMGRFHIAPKNASSHPRWFRTLLAVDDDGRAALHTSLRFMGAHPGRQVEAGDLILEQGFAVVPSVREDGNPAPGAEVRVRYQGQEITRVLTDERGTAVLPLLPANTGYEILARRESRVARRIFHLPDQAIGPLVMDLASESRVRVRVIDALTKRPIASARVMPWRLWMPEDIRSTDKDGWTTIPDLESGTQVQIIARASGYKSPLDGPIVACEAESITIELDPIPECKWRIGGDGIPQDGLPVSLVRVPDPQTPVSGKARVEDGWLVIEGQATESWGLLASLPDGRVAHVARAWGRAVPERISFTSPRTLTVRLLETGVNPIPGFNLVFRDDATAQCFAVDRATDSDGIVRIDCLPARTIQILAHGRILSRVDLREGDRSVEIEVPAERRVRIQLSVNGERRFPRKHRVAFSDPGATWLVSGTNPSDGTITGRVRPHRDTNTIVLELHAPGFPSITRRLDLEAAGDEVVVEADFLRGGTVQARIVPPMDGSYYVWLEQWQHEKQRWRMIRNHRPTANQEIRLAGILPGRYRLRDCRSSTVGEPFDLEESLAGIRTTLDLSSVAIVTGRVEVRGLEKLPLVDILVTPAQGDSSEPWHIKVAEDGSFVARVPGDRPMILQARSEDLVSGPTGARVEVTGAATDVVLHMSRAPVLALHLRDPGGSDLEGMFVPVSLLRDHTSREILDHLKPRVSNGKIHISVTHESARVAFINLPPFAPAFVHDLPTAPLGRGLTLLEMDLGASIRVALTPPGSGPMPQLILKARSLDGPSYTRSTRSVSKDSMTVTGLLPGRLEVSIQASGTKREYLRKTVQVTAAQALVLSCDL